MKFGSDIDIDFADRQAALACIQHIPAIIDNKTVHNTGIYVTNIPQNPLTGRANIDYKQAELRGYIKLDLLNVNVYNQVKHEADLESLMTRQPPWHKLYEKDFCQQVIHIGNHHDIIIRMPEAVNSIPRLAMLLAIIRPAKRHLIGKPWLEVAETVWQPPQDGTYYFKRSHSVSYAHLVVVHMNLLDRSANQGN